MTFDKHEFVHLQQFPADFCSVTMLPDRTGLAVANGCRLVHFQYDYTERPNLPLQELRAYTFDQYIVTYFVVPECNAILLLAGTNVWMVNAITFAAFTIFENVTALCSHHSGLEPIVVPLLQLPSKQQFDLRYSSMHLSQQAINYACAAQYVPRVAKGVIGTGLFDFLIIMDGLAFVIYAYASTVPQNTCVAYGPDGLQLSFYDTDARSSTYNPQSIKFEYALDMSNLAYFVTENQKKQKISIQSPLWVGDYIYYYAIHKYYALDLRRLALANAAKHIEQEAPLFDITDFSTPIIESPTSHRLKISVIGPEMNAAQIASSVTTELLARVRGGISIDLRDPKAPQYSQLYSMQEIARAQIYKFREGDYGKTIGQIVSDAAFYEALKDIKPQRPVVNEGEKFARLESLFKQTESVLGVSSVGQTPYVLVARPIQISFLLDGCAYGMVASQFRAAELSSGKSSGYEQIHDQKYVVCDYTHEIVFPSEVVEVIRLPVALSVVATSVFNLLQQNYTAQISCLGVRTPRGLFKLYLLKNTKRLFEELRYHILRAKQLDSISINNRKEQLIQAQTNDLDKSELLVLLALMHYALGNYQQCANFLLEAPLVNPVSVVKLFLTNMHFSAFKTQKHKFRRDGPGWDYVQRSQNFGVFTEYVRAFLGDAHWKFLSDTYNRNDQDQYTDVDLLEWRGQHNTTQEENYDLFRGYNSDFVSFAWPWVQAIENKERLLDIPETQEVSFYKLNDMPNYQLDSFHETAQQHIMYLAYYLRCYLDNKMNFKQYMIQAFKHSYATVDPEMRNRMINGHQQLQTRMDRYPRNDARNIILLRTVFAILLSSSPFNVEEGYLFNLFFLRPEEQEIVNLKTVCAMLVSTYKEDIENAIGLLTLSRRYKDAGHLASFAKSSTFTNKQDIQQFRYSSCLLYSFCLQDGATCIAGELEQLSLEDYEYKQIYWDFVPHVCRFDSTSAVYLLSKKYKFLKKYEQQVQEIIFDKVSIKFSSSLKNYMKPPKDELIAELAETFTSQFLAEFLAHIRFNDLESKKDKHSQEYIDEYIRQRAYVMVFLFIVSKCVSLCHAEYIANKYNFQAPSWRKQILSTWLGADTAEFLNSYLPLYNDEDDTTQMSFFTSVARHLQPVVYSLRNTLYQLSFPEYQHPDELQSEHSDPEMSKRTARLLSSEQLTTEIQELSNVVGYFIIPYQLCLIKSGNVDQAVQLQFVDLFSQANFYQFFAKVLKLKQQRLVSDSFAGYNPEQLQPFLKKINPSAVWFNLNVQRFEQVLDSLVQFSRSIVISICREKERPIDEVDQIIDQDNIAYCYYIQLKSAACRSQILLLHELLKCFNLTFYAQMIDLNAYQLVVDRLTLPGSKTAQIIAKYAPQRFLRLLYRKMNCQRIMHFLRDAFNENAENQRELSMDIACAYEGGEDVLADIRVCQKGSFVLTARSKCDNCGGLLLKSNFGAFRSQESENGFVLTHIECEK